MLSPSSGVQKEMATTPAFLPGESHGQRSLAGYSPWGCKESDTAERLTPHRGPGGREQRVGRAVLSAVAPGEYAFLAPLLLVLQASLGLWLPRSCLQGQTFHSLFVFAWLSPLGVWSLRPSSCKEMDM